MKVHPAPTQPALCASHLATESARPGLGASWDGDAKEAGRMTRHGVGSRGIILLLGGVGSSAGGAAAADCSERAISRVVDDGDDRENTKNLASLPSGDTRTESGEEEAGAAESARER
uniref:DUF834 domain-containing protein n=1 Tax=Oryza brachyantha TaxID=4533 RepID=J3M7F6_ORYBR